MNCPRCTNPIPEGGKFCPSCGLDLELINEEPFQSETRDDADGFERMDERDPHASPRRGEETPFWTGILAIRDSENRKRPGLAATMAFFLGPFAYLYLEQMTWFWLALLGGSVLVILTQMSVLPLLLIGGMIHAYDVARTMNERRATLDYGEIDY